MAEVPAVEMKGVSFSYNGFPVLEDVDISVARGDLVGVVGPNGGGKTTLLKLILGLLKPGQGSVRVFGRNPTEARSLIGYLPQYFTLDRYFPISVAEVVLLGRLGEKTMLGPFRRADRAAACEALRRVGMHDLRNASFTDLSGGQRQRVLIARSLVSNPQLLLLDEPTASLDLPSEQEFYSFLRELTGTLTIMMVSHDVGVVSSFVRKVICVKRCVVVHPAEGFTGEMIQDIYGKDFCLVRHDKSLAEGRP